MPRQFYGLIMCLALVGAMVASIYVPIPDGNVYFFECAICAVWIIADAINRKAKLVEVFTWSFFALLFAPIVAARWYAYRPLHPGEFRKGGADSNFLAAFGVITVMFTGVAAAVNFLNYGPDRGFEILINTGFAVAGTAAVLAMAARQENVLERGHSLGSERVAELIAQPQESERNQ